MAGFALRIVAGRSLTKKESCRWLTCLDYSKWLTGKVMSQKNKDKTTKLSEIKGIITLDADLAIKQAERLDKALTIANVLARRLEETLLRLKIKVE